MQPLIAVIHMDHEENLRPEVIGLNFDLHEIRKYLNIPFFLTNSIILGYVFIFFAST